VNAHLPATRTHKHNALIALVGVSVVLGILDAALGLPLRPESERLAFTFGGNLALLAIGFRWLALDAHELDIRRPGWLNAGIVLLAAVFMPYYLYKTRPAGRRLPAILGFFALVFACMFGSALGAVALGVLTGAAAG
jgi:hypothetical protein